MLSARNQIRIISLGAIVTPSIMKTIEAFTTVIAEKKQANPLEVGKTIGEVLQKNMLLLNDFKVGKVTEENFTERMIVELENATLVKLTPSEFDRAWNAMNPSYEAFVDDLKQLVAFNSQPHQQVIFISFTNPKDIKHLIAELEKNKINYKAENDNLVEIAGIPLMASYVVKQNKADLLKTVIKNIKTESSQNTVANNMSRLFAISVSPMSDIKYIHCDNDFKVPTSLQADLDATNKSLEKTNNDFSIETIFWVKRQQKLAEVLNDRCVVSSVNTL